MFTSKAFSFPRRRFLLGAAGLGFVREGLPQNTRGATPFSYFQGEPMRIGNQVQLLMDDYMVEDRWKLTRQSGKVIKHARNPIVVQDKPWEGAAAGTRRSCTMTN